MRIPSGDLAPVRRRRRGRRSRARLDYGPAGRRPSRRQSRNRLPILLVVLLVFAIAGGAYLLRRDDAGAGRVAHAARCTSPAPAPVPRARSVGRTPTVTPLTAVRLPAPGSVRLRLLNGTARNGLARTIGNSLAARGFRVSGMGNAPKLAGPTRVYFGPGGRPAATLAVAHVLGAQLVATPTAAHGAVDVVLGTSFVRLRTAPEMRAFAHALAGAKPVPPPARPPAAVSPTSPAVVVAPSCR